VSTPFGTGADRDRRVGEAVDTGRLFRVLALAGALTLISSYVGVFYFITSLVGGTGRLLTVTIGAFVGATLAAAYVRERVAAVVTAVLLVAGSVIYLSSVPEGLSVLFVATGEVFGDVIALLTGLPIRRIKNPGIWTVGYVPAPLFLSWYLALRRRYVASAAVGGVALGVLVLTGDAGGRVTLAGTIGGIATVGFGELERYDGTIAQADTLAILFAAMMAVSLFVPLVPGGSANPIYVLGAGDGGSPETLEASLTNAPEETRIQGSIRLSPEKRFTVQSEEPLYYRAAVYDRFSGESWLRTGEPRPYEGNLEEPPGQTREVTQTITAESDTEVMPAAYQPISVAGDQAGDTQVTDQGAFLPESALSEGDTYTVTSAVIDASPEELREAGTDYPDEITDTYLQTGDLSDRFGEHTEWITQNAENPYETARVIERYLAANKEYSLDVDRPEGNVAEEFLFNMRQGYCVYYATTMVMMLRSQGVPARYAVGYLPGTETSENTYTVRGLDSHAWVEVYFPDEGWVVFDPTPGAARQAAEQAVLEEAAQQGTITQTETPTPTTTAPPTTTATGNGTTVSNTTTAGDATTAGPGPGGGPVPGAGSVNATISATVAIPDIDNGSGGNGSDPGEGSGGGPSIPPPEDVALGGMLLLGLVAGVHRSGVPERLWRAFQLRWQGPRQSPNLDTERAYRRLEMLLERRYRPRRGEETPRDYVEALSLTGADERVDRVAQLYELAHYGNGVTDAEAAEAIGLVDELIGERSILPGRLSR